jgi:hypothetical protein
MNDEEQIDKQNETLNQELNQKAEEAKEFAKENLDVLEKQAYTQMDEDKKDTYEEDQANIEEKALKAFLDGNDEEAFKFRDEYNKNLSDRNEYLYKRHEQETASENQRIVTEKISQLDEEIEEERIEIQKQLDSGKKINQKGYNQLIKKRDDLKDSLNTENLQDAKELYEENKEGLEKIAKKEMKAEQEAKALAEKQERKHKRTIKALKIVTRIAGFAGGFAGGMGLATLGPLGIPAAFIGGGVILKGRDKMGILAANMLNKSINKLDNEIEKLPDGEEKKKKIEERNNRNRKKEIIFTCVSGFSTGFGVGLIASGGYGLIANAFTPAVGATGAEATEAVSVGGSEYGANVPSASTAEVTSINFDPSGGSVHVVEDLGLNQDVVQQFVDEGKLLGPNLLTEGSPIGEAHREFLTILKNSNISNVNMGSIESTDAFFKGIVEINKIGMQGPIPSDAVQNIAQQTINSLAA